MTEVELSIRKFTVRNIRFMDMACTDTANKDAATRRTLQLGSDLTDEEINNLSVKDGIKLTKAINELNGFTEAFQ